MPSWSPLTAVTNSGNLPSFSCSSSHVCWASRGAAGPRNINEKASVFGVLRSLTSISSRVTGSCPCKRALNFEWSCSVKVLQLKLLRMSDITLTRGREFCAAVVQFGQPDERTCFDLRLPCPHLSDG